MAFFTELEGKKNKKEIYRETQKTQNNQSNPERKTKPEASHFLTSDYTIKL